MSNEEVKKNTELCKEKRELTKDELLQVTGGVELKSGPGKDENPMRSLQGRVPGMQITTNDQLGGASSIRVRGYTST